VNRLELERPSGGEAYVGRESSVDGSAIIKAMEGDGREWGRMLREAIEMFHPEYRMSDSPSSPVQPVRVGFDVLVPRD
jgi:hypothetical protein